MRRFDALSAIGGLLETGDSLLPKRHDPDFFDLRQPETQAMHSLVDEIQNKVEVPDRKPSGPAQRERKDSNLRPPVLDLCGGRFAL